MFTNHSYQRNLIGQNSLCAALALAVITIASSNSARADDGHPVALRCWPNHQFSVETMWNLKIHVGDSNANRQPADFDTGELAVGDSATLRRVINQPNIDLIPTTENKPQTPIANDIRLNRSPLKSDSHGSIVSLTVDRLTFVFLDEIKTVDAEAVCQAVKQIATTGSLTIVATSDAFDTAACNTIVERLKPATMVVGDHVTLVSDKPVTIIPHNTLATSSATPSSNRTTCVTLSDKPYVMTDELVSLFSKKETACSASQSMFAKLSVEQMNFRPPNQTHTPRWNAEHMMGRELLFFSQIYHAVDPSISIMNLNPKQMPKDYSAAHADWSGTEEALQMQRVAAFTRRFAYLLHGMELDQKPAGSKFWTPRGLLKQMQRHYNEHSANVVKKMELETWPTQ